MLIKFSYFAILVELISISAAKHPKYVDFDDVSESDEDTSETSCESGKCALASKEIHQEAIRSTEKTTTDKVEDELQQLNILNFVKLLSLFANDGKRGDTKISLNVRDIQSGFHNGGSKYHVGNVHRELNRDKRDTEFELNENSTPKNEDSVTVLALTSESTTDNVQTSVQELSSNELVRQSTTENSQANNDNQSANVNVRQAEPDNFQDSNVTDIYDSIANDTTTASVNGNNETSDYDRSNKQITITEISHNNLNNEIISHVDNKTYVSFNDSSGKDSEIANALAFSAENNLQTENNNETQSSKVKIALTRKDLNNIQNALDDELGVKSKGAIPVANFSLTGPLDSDKKNPVVVIVYNCSCGSNHSQENSTEHAVISNDTYNNNETVLNTRRTLTQDETVFTEAQTEVKSEETKAGNTAKEQLEANDKLNNAILENEMLQKCNSLLSLQLKNNANETLETRSIDQADVALKQLSTGDNVVNNSNNFDDQNQTENVETSVKENIVTINNNTAKQTHIDDFTSSSQLQINNDTNISPAESNTDVVDQTVFLVNESLNDAINIQASNLPTTSTVVEEQLISKRKRRSVRSDTKDKFKSRNVIYRNKRGVTDIINSIFQYLMIVSSNSTNDTQGKPKQKNDEVVAVTEKSNYKKNIITKDLLNSPRKKRSVNHVLDYIHKNYQSDPDNLAADSKGFKHRVITKRGTKIFRNPKYYEYANDKPNLLESDPNLKEDGTILNIKSLNDDIISLDNFNEVSLPVEQNTKNFNSVEDIKNRDILSSKNTGDMTKDNKYLNLLSFRPVYVNIYFQLLMKNLDKDQESEH